MQKSISYYSGEPKKFNEEVLEAKEEIRISFELLEVNPKIKAKSMNFTRMNYGKYGTELNSTL
jgi:Fe-S-cluster formation regulator IscX/YfhJ